MACTSSVSYELNLKIPFQLPNRIGYRVGRCFDLSMTLIGPALVKSIFPTCVGLCEPLDTIGILPVWILYLHLLCCHHLLLQHSMGLARRHGRWHLPPTQHDIQLRTGSRILPLFYQKLHPRRSEPPLEYPLYATLKLHRGMMMVAGHPT